MAKDTTAAEKPSTKDELEQLMAEGAGAVAEAEDAGPQIVGVGGNGPNIIAIWSDGQAWKLDYKNKWERLPDVPHRT